MLKYTEHLTHGLVTLIDVVKMFLMYNNKYGKCIPINGAKVYSQDCWGRDKLNEI